MKKFFGEFKKFITRGNVLDMAVGVIVGGAFTGIVNGVSNFILKPIINYLIMRVLGGEGLSGAITFLSKVEKTVQLTLQTQFILIGVRLFRQLSISCLSLSYFSLSLRLWTN